MNHRPDRQTTAPSLARRPQRPAAGYPPARDHFGDLLLVTASLVGLVAFFSPLLVPVEPVEASALSHSADAPLLFAVLLGLSLLSALRAAQQSLTGSRLLALTAGLVTANAALRLVPSLLGATPVFLLVILSGYVFGARLGFLVGALSMALSALLTGGVGPWLPYQMFALGWVGAGARLLRLWPGRRGERLRLALYGALTGFAFGFLMNLWFWPFLSGPPESPLYRTPDASLGENLQRYLVFYVATSLVFDGSRALGNVVLILALGQPGLHVLRRFQRRLTAIYRPPADLTIDQLCGEAVSPSSADRPRSR